MTPSQQLMSGKWIEKTVSLQRQIAIDVGPDEQPQHFTQGKDLPMPTALRRFTTICLLLNVLLAGCSPDQAADNTTKKELVIYCGITMTRPMAEIAAIIEQETGSTIKIIKGGSGNLLKSILHNEVGDMYLPGSDKYFETIEENTLDW